MLIVFEKSVTIGLLRPDLHVRVGLLQILEHLLEHHLHLLFLVQEIKNRGQLCHHFELELIGRVKLPKNLERDVIEDHRF